MVVDDSSVIRSLVRATVEMHRKGASVIEIANGAEALAALQQHTDARLVLLDWSMPQMDGLEVVRRVRASGSRLPIVMVTALATDAHRGEALAAGVTDFVTKPFKIAELWTRIEPYLR